MIKSTKNELIAELEERNELSKTRSTVLTKQEARVKESIKEQESKINEMITKTSADASSSQQPPKFDPRK